MKAFELIKGRIVLIENHHAFKAYVDLLGLVKGLKEENNMLDKYRRIEILFPVCFPVGAVFIQLR